MEKEKKLNFLNTLHSFRGKKSGKRKGKNKKLRKSVKKKILYKFVT